MKKSIAVIAVTGLLAMSGLGLALAQSGDRMARVAGGEQVTLAKSRLSAKELQERRPQMQALIPKVR